MPAHVAKGVAATLPVTRVVHNVVNLNGKLFSEEKICRQYVMLRQRCCIHKS